MPKISVIIPVYNVEKYLDRCLTSLINQTFTDFEVLLVDDGSTDGSGVICDAWAEKDSRFRVFHQENAGQAVARNRMLDVADGEYIAFLDSDDYIHPQMYEILMKNVAETGAKISIGGYCSVADYQQPENVFVGKVTRWKGKEFLKHCLLDSVDKKCWVLWDKIFHRSCFEHVRMPEGRIYEDNAVVYKMLYECDKIADCEAKLYYYYQNDQSTVNQKFKLKHLDWLKVLEEMIEYFRGKDDVLFDKVNGSYLFALADLHKKVLANFGKCPEEKELRSKLKKQYMSEKKKYELSIKSHPWVYDELYPLYAKIYWKLH